MDTTIIYSILFFLTFPIASYILYKLTKDEKELINFYFLPLKWITAISAAIFYSINIMYAFVLTYIFLTMILWEFLLKR